MLEQIVPGRADPVFTGVAATQLPDGTAAVVCAELDGSLLVWDLATGSAMRGLAGDPNTRPSPEVACTRLPDGTPVAVSGGGDGVLRVWDLAAGRSRGEARGDRIDALACMRMPAGMALAVTADLDGTVSFWDVGEAAALDQVVRCDNRRPRVACAWVNDAPVVVIGDGAALRIWDPLIRRFTGSVETGFEVFALACSGSAGTTLAVAGSDRMVEELDDGTVRRYGTVQAWNLATGQRFGRPLTVSGGEILDLAATQLPDGTPLAVSVNRYASLGVWNLDTGQHHGSALPHVGDSPRVACTRLADGTPVVVTAEHDVRVWRI